MKQSLCILLLCATLATLSVTYANAQRYEEIPTLKNGEELRAKDTTFANRLRVGLAFAEPWQLDATLAPLFWGNGLDFGIARATDISYKRGGGIFAEYEHPIGERLSVTTTASATFCFADFYGYHDYEEYGHNHIGNTGVLTLSLTFGASYDYLRVGRLRLWGNAGLGLVTIYPMEFYTPLINIPLIGPVYPVIPTFDLYPLCVSFGGERGVFVECGVGSRGVASGGCYFTF